jgi:pimeloyl-ACP methyl ester carboxylesterase
MVELTQRFRIGDVELAWDRWGPGGGTPLVLGHGFSGSADDFALLIPTLAADRPVVALDHRGHGRSTKTGDAAGYTVGQLTDDLAAFLDTNVGEPVDLLGHSMGGLVSIELALDRPDLVRSLILMDTSAWSFQSDDPELRALLASFFETFDPSRGLPNLANLVNDETPLIEAATPDEWRARRRVLQAGFDPVALKALGAALWLTGFPPVRDRLGEITAPTTVIAGANDHPFVDQAPALGAELPDAEVVIIDGAYHSPQLTHAEAWMRALTEHLHRVDRSRSPSGT